MPALSLRRNFSWNLAGNAVYNFSTWLLVVLLARLAAPEVVGKFALSLAITAPVFLWLGLNLRIAIATDTVRRWTMRQYLRTRSVTGVVSIAVTLVAGYILHLRGMALISLGVLAVAKSVEALGQTLYGYYQLHGRLDYIAGSMILRAAIGATLFVVGFVLSHQLVFACAGLLAGWTLALLIWDNPHRRKLQAEDPASYGGTEQNRREDSRPIRALVLTSIPLGIDAGLNSLTVNAPRFAIQFLMGAAYLGRFAVPSYFAQVVGMVTGALADGVVSQLAFAYSSGRRRAFDRLMVRLTLFSLGIAAAVFLGCLLLGAPVLGLVLGPQYVDQPLLLLLVLSAAVTTLRRCICRGLQATHQYSKIAISDVITLGLVVLSSIVLVPHMGLNGAAISISIGTAAGTIDAAIFLRLSMRHFPVVDEETVTPPPDASGTIERVVTEESTTPPTITTPRRDIDGE